MSTFKDQLKSDASVFLNLSEFAEEIDIDGVMIAGMIEPIEMRGNRSYSYASHDREYSEEIMLYVKRSDFKFIPPVGHKLKINKKAYVVVSTPSEDAGILEIRLGANANP